MADFSINAEITANSKGFTSGLANAQKSLTSFSAGLKKVITAVGAFTVALKGISSVSKFVTEATSEFAKANSNIVKGTGATGAALQNLSKSVRNAMKNGVGRSASEVGEMVADLNTRFGVTGKELEKLVDEFDQFSDVTGVDTKQSIESLADVMAKWNISATETDDLMDELVYASQASGLGVNDLMSALKNGQSTFDAFGMSMTESIGFLSQLKTQGIDSASALSALKIGMAKFAASGKDVDKEFQKVSEQIKNATSDSEALQIAVTNFGAKGGSELVKVFKNNGLDSFISQLENAKGTLNKTAEASRTSADAFQDLKAQIQATFFSGATDSYITQIIDEVKIGFTDIDDDAMYNVFNNLYKAVQICVNSINALIHGDWETLWDYAKLVVLKLVNSVSEALQKMVDDLGIKVNVAAGVIGGLATGFGILTGNLAVAAAGVGVAVGTIIATNKTAMEQVSKDTQAEIDKTEKEIIARTQKNAKDGSEKLLKDLKRTSSEVKNEVEETGETVVETTEETGKTLSREVPKWLKSITKGYEEISDSFEAFGEVATRTVATAAEVGAQAFGDMFSQLGEDLVLGEASFQNYAAMAVEAISKVLASLGSELLALAATRAVEERYAEAAIAATGATAAFVASGVASGVASALKKQAEATVEAAEGFEDYLEKIKEISAETSSFEDIFVNVSDIQNTYNETLKTMNERLAEQNNQLAAAQNELNNLNIAVGSLAASGLLLSASITAAFAEGKRKEIEQIRQEIDATNHEIEALKKSADDLINEELKKATANALSNLKAVNAELQNTINNYQKYVYSGLYSAYTEVLSEQLKSNVLGAVQSIYSDLQSVGVSLGSMFIDNFVDGATSSDFFTSIKDYMRENIIKLTVYSESFIEKISAQSTSLLQAMTIGDYDKIAEIKSSLKSLYEEQATAVAMIDSALDDIFSDVIEVTDEAVSYVTDSVEDMGESISDTLISSLENGLDNGEFLDSMKKYIRKMVIQTVVYTENLQSQIEAIGKAISDGIASGFSESGLDALRMDFSYLYYQAENSMSKIDSILDAVFSGYATGTQNATAGLHLVGEAGPELVRFNGGEQVYNASDTRKMLSGGNVGGNNFNVTFNNLQDTTAYTMLQQLKQYNREMAINGIM